MLDYAPVVVAIVGVVSQRHCTRTLLLDSRVLCDQELNKESMEMLGIIGKLRENGLHHARTAHTRRSPAMRVQPAMEVEERPDAASSPGSPCSPLSSRCSGRSAGSPPPPSTPGWRHWNRRLRAPVCLWSTPSP